jgi:hypothetical protein
MWGCTWTTSNVSRLRAAHLNTGIIPEVVVDRVEAFFVTYSEEVVDRLDVLFCNLQ